KEKDKEKKRAHETKQIKVDLYIPTTVSVGQFAKLLNVRLRTLQRKMDEAGMQAETSYDHVLTSDYAALLAEEFGRNPIINDEAAFDLHPPPLHPKPQLLPSRPPIITIMGHVDHGKTTLLDSLRFSSVAASEAGGITQHIGAFCVPVKMSGDSESVTDGAERLITFLDTPGHAAFSAMRARGTSVTDIVVLVVAADDGVMPQTLEVIELVNREKERGKIGMVVAINKIDKPEADVEKTKLALLSAGVVLEEHGGDVSCVEVSGLTGKGLPDLVETLALMADVMDLRAEQDCPTVGYVLESRIHRGLGPVATVLVTRGTLTPGTPLLAGTSPCSTRRILSPSLLPLISVGPGTPVLITGWKSLPAAGDEVLAGSEADIKRARLNRERKRELECVISGVEAINIARKADKEREEKERVVAKLKKGRGGQTEGEEECVVPAEAEKRKLRVIVKGDVSGSVEALVGAIEGIGNHLASVKVVSTGVGDVSDSDVMMAKAAEAMIIAFSVSVPRSVQASASQNHVPVYSSDIIYRVMDDVRDRVISLLPCTYETKVTGEATVLQLFDIHIKGKLTKKIAGCRVTNGIVERSNTARVMREGKIVHEGCFLDALRQMKKDMTEVKKGSECGINLHEFDDLREGDLIQMFQTIEVPGVL
ncbi:initiation factor 2, partial [Gyrodon lividus]